MWKWSIYNLDENVFYGKNILFFLCCCVYVKLIYVSYCSRVIKSSIVLILGNCGFFFFFGVC